MSEPEYRRSLVKAPGLSGTGDTTALPWWVPVIVTVGALLLIAGAMIAFVHPALLVGPAEQINGAVRVYAGYLVSRNLAIAVMLFGTLCIGARQALAHVMVLAAIVQILDAGIDCIESRYTLVPGVAVLGIVFFIGASRASGNPLWKIASWRGPR